MVRALRAMWWLASKAVRVAWISTLVIVPLFGFWLASSLAAYHNASPWLALLVGLALFPLLPVGWDVIAAWRRRHDERPRVLTRLDRIVIRTLLIDGVFLAAVLYFAPHVACRALAARGDWMVDGQDGPIAQRIRDGALWLADAFEQRWHDRDSTYGSSDAVPTPAPPPGPTPTPMPTPAPAPAPSATPGWPMPAAVDPQVLDMPDSVQTSVDAVGKYLAARITDRRRLVKALHDYVDLRLTYDHATEERDHRHDSDPRASQEADAVFATRTAVCEGYAKLLAALGKAAGVDIAYITGYARDSRQHVDDSARGAVAGTDPDAALRESMSGYLHAWNAARIDSDWELIDATWDDTDSSEPIRSTYLFTPPALFAYQHLPDSPQWQLLAKPLSVGAFVRQPLLVPTAGALGVSLVDPDRSQVTVEHDLAIALANPRHAALVADVVVAGTRGIDKGTECAATPVTDEHAVLSCPIGTGQFEVRMYGAPAASADSSGTIHFDYIGSIQVNGR
jgi:transglutaminase-like putative cysteine protease